MTRRSLSIPLVLAMLAGSLPLVLSTASAAQTQEVEPGLSAPVTVETLRPERVVLESELSGRVAPHQRVEIRPQIGGLILERPAQEGARVAAGDVLFRIDPAPLKADLGTAEAALARAEAAAFLAQTAAARSNALLASKAVSLAKNDEAQNNLTQANASLAEARAMVERKRLDLEFATLRAPINGYVAAGLADVGGLAAPGGERALAVLQGLDKVYVDVRLPASDLDAVLQAAENGLGSVAIAKDRGQVLQGKLRSSDVIVDPGTGNISVRIEVDNPDLTLLPGMFVRARVPVGLLPDALLIPEEAVLRTGGGAAQVVIVRADGKATRRLVTLGDRVGNRIVITSGVEPGETVVVMGQDRVPDGISMPVSVLVAAKPAAPQHP